MYRTLLSLIAVLPIWQVADLASADLQMSSVFSDSMVLQRDQPIKIWGWADPGIGVTVAVDDKTATATATAEGRFDAQLPAMPHDGGKPHTVTVTAGDESVAINDVLIGEVYLCSGQSNMQWSVNNSNDADLEKLTAKYPNMRLITVPNRASQEFERTFDGKWQAVTPETVGSFSAVGYFFGRQVHETLDVPVGLINNSWGGSAAEAWIPTETLAAEPMYDEMLANWKSNVANDDHAQKMEKYQTELKAWKDNDRQGKKPQMPRNQLEGNHRPGNLYYGCLTPIIGYPIRGAIWYQGESNAGLAYQYRDLFPRMIKKWRSDWGTDFPFYWVQLADFQKEASGAEDSSWAELREAQSMTLSLPATGQAVIVDLGEAEDIHPKDKQNVAMRLARWTLAKDFGIEIPYQSPTYEKSSTDDNAMMIDFTQVGGGLDTFDVKEIRGFTIAGEDQHFVPAKAEIVDKDTVRVHADDVQKPVAVRYGWANNPVVNLQSAEGLPATPFRTDEFKGVTQK